MTMFSLRADDSHVDRGMTSVVPLVQITDDEFERDAAYV